MNFIKNLCSREFIQIPITWCATKRYAIGFQGWNPEFMDVNDINLISVTTYMSKCLDSFIEMHEKDYVFSEPEFIFQPNDSTFYLRIGTLEKEEYDRRMNERN